MSKRALLSGISVVSALAILGLLPRLDSDRGRARAADRPSSHAATAVSAEAETLGRPDTAPRRTAVERAAEALASDSPAEALDPTAIVGQLLCGGLPVEGADVFLFATRPEPGNATSPLRATRSDALGGFRLAGLEPHHGHVLLAQHPDHLPLEVTVFPGTTESFVLQRAASIAGTVRSALAVPLPGVAVTLRRRHLGPAGMDERVTAISDAEGRWRLTWAAPGMQTLEALRAGHAPDRFRFQVPPGDSDGYELVVDAPGSGFELELYLLESGALLCDTEISIDDAPVRTDARGRLVLPPHPDPNGVPLSLELVGGCRTQGWLRPSLLETGGAVLRVPLARGGVVRGRVVDADGHPVPGAQMTLTGGERLAANPVLPAGLALTSSRSPARSDADGHFELRGVAPREGPVVVQASHPRHPPGRSAPLLLAHLGDTAEVEIRLARGAEVTGNVRLDGRPAALRVEWSTESSSGWTRADERGAYRITGMPAGELRIGARLEGEEQARERAGDLRLFAEEGSRLVADLERHPEGARLRGLVRDTRGTAVAGATVTALLPPGASGDEPRATSGPDGRFVLTVPDVPALVVVAEEGPRQARASAMRAADDEIELVLPALAPLVLRVVDAARREPVQDFQIHWRDASGSFQRLVKGRDGFAGGPDGTLLAELPPGRTDLVVSARLEGYLPAWREAVELGGTSAATVEFALTRGIELELVLEAAPDDMDCLLDLRRARTFVASAEQWAERERGGSWFTEEVRGPQSLRPEADGTASIGALPSGRYRFFDLPRGVRLDPAEFDVPASSPRRVVRVQVTRER